MTAMPIYYINLASAPGRRAEMERQFAALGLVAERVEAVTPADISAEDIAAYCNPDRYRWLAPTELACSLSHIKVWREIVASGARHGVVFEDDAILSNMLPDFLSTLEQSSLEAGLIKVEVCPDRIRAEAEPRVVIGRIGLRRIFGFSGGTAAYVISSAVIDRIIDRPELRDTPLDRALFDTFERLSPGFLQLDPGLAIQADQLPELGGKLETSAIKTDLKRRFDARHVSPLRHRLNTVRRWSEQAIGAGLRKTYLDATGIKKRKVAFLP